MTEGCPSFVVIPVSPDLYSFDAFLYKRYMTHCPKASSS
jgi:hypothetical protein